MANIIYSNELLNTAVIAVSAKWFVPVTPEADLKPMLSLDRCYYNYCKITNTSGEDIKVSIGNDTKRINSGDGYEWDRDVPVHFSAVTVENLDTINAIQIGEIIVEYARVR